MTRSTRHVSRRIFAAGGLSALATFGLSRLSSGQTAPNAGKTVPPEVEQANIAVVNDFCAAFDRRDLNKALSLLADNCIYRASQARPPLAGKEKVAERIKEFIDRVVAFKVLRTVALGPIVLNERDDVFGPTATQAGRTYRVAAGVFFVENGKIVEWTDYVLL